MQLLVPVVVAAPAVGLVAVGVARVASHLTRLTTLTVASLLAP